MTPTMQQVRDIARQAWLYGTPVVEMYRTLYAQAIDAEDPNFKAPFNAIGNTARVFTPKDTAFITPNSDTPYSFLWMDLRAEPLVLQLPAIEPDRYCGVQLIDLYTHNVDYLGTRNTGNGGGTFLIAGPGWNGAVPSGVERVVRIESDIAYALIRTQLFDDADLARVREIQAGYRVQALSAYAGATPPPPAPRIDWPRPPQAGGASLDMFRCLNFMLQFAPPHPDEAALLGQFALLGIGAGLAFDERSLDVEGTAAMAAGIRDAREAYAQFAQSELATGRVTSADLFGTRKHLRNNYMYRYAGATLGIFGNSAQEAIYLAYFKDSQGRPLDAASHRYELRLPKGGLPPADAFWSITMYDGTSKLLVDNPLQRYLINSRMLASLQRDEDGGITLHVDRERPEPSREANWLPAPDGPFYCILRIYLPRAAVFDGTWKRPALEAVAEGSNA
jgi:hypothetical protein